MPCLSHQESKGQCWDLNPQLSGSKDQDLPMPCIRGCLLDDRTQHNAGQRGHPNNIALVLAPRICLVIVGSKATLH